MDPRPIFLLAIVLSISVRAEAQDVAMAQELYSRGVADFRAGRYDSACRMLNDSYRIDPLPGVLFTLATCEARAGRIATAAARYDDFLQRVATLPPDQRAMQEERRQAALSERAALAPELSYLTISVPTQVLAKGATVQRDGTILGLASVGIELPIDPGPHLVVVRTVDGKSEERRISIAKREHATVAFESPAPARSSPEGRPAREQPVALEPRRVSPWLYVSGGVAAAGIGVGTIAGLFAISHKKVVDSNCLGPACNPDGKAAADSARTEALVSTVGFGVALAGMATALIVYLAQPSAPSRQSMVHTTPTVAFDGESITLRSSF
jgi:hypothetical protein